jgi:hypothetical protein
LPTPLFWRFGEWLKDQFRSLKTPNVGDDRRTAPVAKQPFDAVCPRRSTS